MKKVSRKPTARPGNVVAALIVDRPVQVFCSGAAAAAALTDTLRNYAY